MSRPPIGVPRCYPGDGVPTLYPGETASALGTGCLAGGPITVESWLVEPTPGWYARYLRVRWRIWGRWFARGTPQLEVSIHPLPRGTPDSVGPVGMSDRSDHE